MDEKPVVPPKAPEAKVEAVTPAVPRMPKKEAAKEPELKLDWLAIGRTVEAAMGDAEIGYARAAIRVYSVVKKHVVPEVLKLFK